MSTHYVSCTSKVVPAGKFHDHIASVRTSNGTRFTRTEVVQSIRNGNVWYTYPGGTVGARIEVVGDCGHGCSGAFIRTVANSTTVDNLDSLPACR